jgi:arylformamidase
MSGMAHSCSTTVGRRTLLIGGAAGAVLAIIGRAAAQAQPAARVKGPRVWLDMDQQELDDAYDQAVYAPNLQQLVKRQASNSEAVRGRLGPPKRLAYGATPVEGLDLYATKRPNAPVHIFIHGGAWRTGSAKNSAFPAELFVHAGAHYIAPDFNNVLETKGDLMPMADQVRGAIAWVYKHAADFGGDRDRIYLSGFSSGGHLGGVAVVTDWQKEFGIPPNVIKGALLCSGLYDLRAPRLSARSKYVNFTDEAEQALSPQRHLDRLNVPLVLAYGTYETPEFQRQTRDFAAAVKAAGQPVQLLVGEGYNHFEIIETLANPYGLLGRAALEQMKLAPA